ncbi:cortexin domain-containing 1 isoform X1 [Peromyscus leucopus]|uniref:cortexin domain-containing 1 isoform X1 n=1 Tax=Peromyscus leucopus TaxID=10041 RepID=UPI00188541CA|nr:cortexin domain-containing 1 isoform X1 [Peromyscus leucopus]
MGSSQESFMVWGSGFCFPASQRDFCRADAPFPEPAALHWGPKFLPAFPLEQRPSLAFKMPGRPQLCSQPLLAAARGSPRRRRALTQPQSGCSTEQDLESACPEPPGKHRSLEPRASGAGAGGWPVWVPRVSTWDSPGQKSIIIDIFLCLGGRLQRIISSLGFSSPQYLQF